MNAILLPIVQYVIDLRLFTETLPNMAVIISSAVAYCTLHYHLSSCLARKRAFIPNSGDIKFDMLCKAKQWLVLPVLLNIATLVLVLARGYFGGTGHIDALSICGILSLFITIVLPLDIIILAIVGKSIEDFIFEYNYEIADSESQRIDSIVYLKSGRAIRGWLPDPNQIGSKTYFGFVREDRSVTTIALENVAAIFLQNSYIKKRFLSRKRFKEGPKKLYITFPNREDFPDTKYFQQDAFKVLKITKPTTSSKFAIIDSQFIEEVNA